MIPEGLKESREGRCLRWTIDRPSRRNAITPEMLEFMDRRAAQFDGEVVVITSTGEVAFCAGFDLDALRDAPVSPPPDTPLLECTKAMDDARAVFIAALPGYAIGAGVELACACDFRLAAPQTSFRVPAGALGVVYHPAGVGRMRAALGSDATARLLMRGESLSAEALANRGAVEVSVDPRGDAQRLGEAICDQSLETVIAHRLLLRCFDRAAIDEATARRHEAARERAWQRKGEERDNGAGDR